MNIATAPTRILEGAIILVPDDVYTARQPLPKSWRRAAGLLREKKDELAQHIAMVRAEWEEKR